MVRLPAAARRARPRGLGRRGRESATACGARSAAVRRSPTYVAGPCRDDAVVAAARRARRRARSPARPLGCAINVFAAAASRAGQTGRDRRHRLPRALLVQLAVGAGARVIAVFSRPRRRGARARRRCVRRDDDACGVAESTTALCDVVIEAAGVAGAARPRRAPRRASAAGSSIAGYHQDGPRTVDMQLWNWRGIDVVNAHERDPARRPARACEAAAAAVAAGRLDPAPLVHPHASRSTRSARRSSSCAQRPDGFVKARGDDAVSAVATDRGSASSASAGSAAQPAAGDRARAASPRSPADRRPGAVEGGARPCASTSCSTLGARRHRDRDAERAARRAGDRGARARRSRCSARSRSRATRAETRARRRRGAGGRSACSASTSPTATRDAAQAVRELVAPARSARSTPSTSSSTTPTGRTSRGSTTRALSGGGCVIDLGIHLVDLALWIARLPAVTASSRLSRQRCDGRARVEDYAVGAARARRRRRRAARLLVEPARRARLRDRGERSTARDGGARAAQRRRLVLRLRARALRRHAARAARRAARRLGRPRRGRVGARGSRRGERFDPAAERLVAVAAVLDRIYGRRR